MTCLYARPVDLGTSIVGLIDVVAEYKLDDGALTFDWLALGGGVVEGPPP